MGKGRGVGQHLDGDHRAGAGEATLGQIGIGYVAQRITAEQDEHVEITGGGRLQHGDGVHAHLGGHLIEGVATGAQRHSAGEQARGHTHVEGAVHIAATQRRQETDAFESVEGDGCIDGDRRGLGDRGPAEDHRDWTRDRSSRSGDGVGRHTGSIAGVARYGVDERSGQEVDLARLRLQRVGSDGAETGAGRGQLDQCGAVVDDGVTQAKEQRPEVFLGVGTDEDDGAARGAGLVDRGARQTQHRLGRKAVAELRIDMVGAEHALSELGPGVLRLVGETGATDHADAGRVGITQGIGGRSESGGPAGGLKATIDTDHRGGETVLAVEGLEAEALLVGEPTPVDAVGVDTEQAQDLVTARLDGDTRTDRVDPRRGDRLFEIPRTGLESIRLGGERTDRADLHRIAREVRGERLIRERVDLGAVAPVHEVDQRVAGDIVGKASAAITENAALAVEIDGVADRDRLLVVPLLLDEAGLARAEGHGLILQRAFATLVAHRAVERVVDEQELEHPILGLLGGLGLGVDGHALTDRDHAARLQGRTTARVDLDQAHPAHADRLHARVVAEPWDVGAVTLGGIDEQFARVGLDLDTVEGDGDRGLLVLDGGHQPTSTGSDDIGAAITGMESRLVILASYS